MKNILYPTVFLALFASLLLGAQPDATNVRMREAVGDAERDLARAPSEASPLSLSVGPETTIPSDSSAQKSMPTAPAAASPAVLVQVPATGAWVLERTEFFVEKVDPALMQKWQPAESGADGAGSARVTIDGLKLNMKVAWSSPPKVLVPGKQVDVRLTISDAGSDQFPGMFHANVRANCPALSAVWYGPEMSLQWSPGERSKEASKAYTPPSAAPGTTMYITAEWSVGFRRSTFYYFYKFTLDAGKAPALASTSSAPAGASARGTSGMNVDKAADKLNAIALPGAVGHCALHVQQALEAGGVGGAGHHLSYARQYGPYLLSLGFVSVPQEGYQPQKGDIVVIQPDPNRGGPGHIAMYDGSQWISDYKQRDSLDTGVRINNLAEQSNRKRYRFYRP